MADFTIFSSKSGIVKLVELLLLIVSMATFFSLHIIEAEDKSASYFVTAMIVSPFLQTVFLLIIYTFGGQVIQKTLYEFMVNSFYTFMIVVASIVLFVMSNDDTGAIASGIFSLLAAAAYGFDSYLSLVNMGAMETATSGPAVPERNPYPMAPELRSQPFSAPPTYNPPASLVGPGPYTLPSAATANSNASGDLSSNRI